MTRFGAMKHLRVLEDAGLVLTRRSRREKLHFLNPVPIRLIHDRWIDKYTERRVSALIDLKTELEAAQVGGAIPGAGGGWAWILSDLKTLLETGRPFAG
jgi:DNA-binding transcriptional ArsR family regulator